ncbi:MAG TPA: glycosyltransferase family 1 protein [Thermoanaerobaculia bacterium]|nr:glycosyltransferase family 1 protein [Thermoanaerobaculia bacterium]
MRGKQILRALLRFGSPRRLRKTFLWLREMAATIRRRRAEPRLTVAVDVNSLYETLTGVGWYLHRLLVNMAERNDLRLRLYGQALVEADPGAPRPVVEFPAGPAIERVIWAAPDGLVVPPWRAHQILRRLAPLLMAADGNRVLFAPNYLFPRLFRFSRGARVATIHDLGVRKVPWAVRPDSGEALREGLDRTILEADLLLTPSAAVRGELIGMGVAPDCARAIHHGTGLVSGAGAGALPPGTPARYALHVGTIEPRKNVPALLAAWRLLRRRGVEPPPLVLCGGFGWKAEEIRREIEEAESEGWLVHLGYVGAEELAALYPGAEMVALPSFYEGFGLPAVEAMRAGAPLVASDIPVLREVAGNAALYAPPDRPDLWADRIAELLGDAGLREELRRRGQERASMFDWGRAAAETAAAFHFTASSLQ